ncbi:hypothetical protein [Actinospica robiniae]|nr:hypothetical protein [Actinospica robiniae]
MQGLAGAGKRDVRRKRRMPEEIGAAMFWNELSPMPAMAEV